MEKYKRMQRREFDIAYEEMCNGRKESHWIWYIFPQIKGLGSSFMCKEYDIQDLDHAKKYLSDEYLRDNLIKITKAVLTHKGKKDIKEIMNIDDIKLLSCMTLFKLADQESNKCGDVFQKVIDAFYEGKDDEKTIEILKKQKEDKMEKKIKKKKKS